jgi:transposase-like protein
MFLAPFIQREAKMSKSTKCPLCGSREVIENPIRSKIKKDKTEFPFQVTSKLHRYKCLKCGNEFD